MMTNSLAEDIVSRGQELADNLNTMGVSDADVEDGLKTLVGKVLDISTSKIRTVLTLNTPMLVYTDEFDVTGTLTDSEENPISGATIQLIWNDGTEHIATGTTNSSGVFSFTSTDPASVSQYSFQLFFAGDNDYNASSSSVVNVNTSKETSVLSITNPASGSSVSTDSVTVSGTLKDNDGTAMSGKSVSFSLNNVSAVTATVESDGSFSKTVTGLVAGSNSITVSFIATTTHTAASQSITVNRATFDGLADLELIDGSQILSYADEQSTPGSQYATLEAQLTNGGSPAAISGVEIEFWDFTDDTAPVLLHSDYTEPDGTVSYTYESLGRGDVPIKAKVGSILTKTYSIEDCLKVWGNLTSTITPNYTMPSTPFEVDFTLTRQSGVGYVRIGTNTNNCLLFGQVGGDGSIAIARMNNGNYSNLQLATTKPSVNVATPIKVVCDGSKYDLTIGNETITNTDVGQALTTLLQVYLTNSNSINNLRIKPL